MQDRLDRLERNISELEARLESLAEEVRELRGAADTDSIGSKSPAAPVEATDATRGAEKAGEDWAISSDFEEMVARHGLVFLAGLASLVLAGAMILRMIATSTRPEMLAAVAGLGVAYCGFLLLVAERKLRRGSTLHGDVFAILVVLILTSLLVEVTHREGGFSQETSYLVLAVFLVLHSIQTARRRRPWPFAVGLLASIVAGVALWGRPFMHPYFSGILALTVGAAYFGARRNDWSWARWIPGVASMMYLMVFGGIAAFVARSDLPHHAFARPVSALAIMSGFFAILVLPSTSAAMFREKKLDPYETFAAVCGAVVTCAGAAGVVLSLPSGTALAGICGMVLCIVFYAAAAAVYGRHGAGRGSFYTLGAIALIYALASLPFLLGGGAALGAAYQILALTLAICAARLGRRSLSVQAHVLTFAAFAVFLFSTITFSPPEIEGRGPPSGSWLLLASGLLALVVYARLRAFRSPGAFFSLSRFDVKSTALVLLLAVGGVEILTGAVSLLHPVASSAMGLESGEAAHTALWYSIQTVLLILFGVIALSLGASLRLGGVTVLAVSMMLVAALKLFLYDSVRVPGLFLVCTSAVLGLALILSSILYRRFRGLLDSEAGAKKDDPLMEPNDDRG